MPTHYVYLLISVVAEVIGTSTLKATEEFTRFWPTALMVVCYGIAFYSMTHVMKVLPIGITYAIWSGLGIVLVSLISWIYYGQKLDMAAIAGIALIITGVLVINLFSKSSAH
ncbi:MAG: QacE family quaternary ammonium compound efflux SMR transporter [Alphaproteobacteria bacterium]|nr:QacE family quaternary ammonium compound efflux SMR transporter [Alphaproteobacteria bacterium]